MTHSTEIAEHFKALHRFAARMLGRADLAEEVAQEALLRLAGSGLALQGESARRWLFVVARNLCLSHLRHASRFPEVPLNDFDKASAGPNPAQAALLEERRRLVAEAVAALPPPMREVIVLREFEELDYAQIAEATGCNLGTVKSRLARAREELRKRLAPMLEVDQ